MKGFASAPLPDHGKHRAFQDLDNRFDSRRRNRTSPDRSRIRAEGKRGKAREENAVLPPEHVSVREDLATAVCPFLDADRVDIKGRAAARVDQEIGQSRSRARRLVDFRQTHLQTQPTPPLVVD